MEIKDFFVFCSKHASSTFQASAIGLAKDNNGINDHDRLVEGLYEEINFPVVFKQEYGKKLVDILGTGWGTLYLISDKMKTILKENNLTGWKTFPIKLYDKKGIEILGYHGFSITGRCGPVDYQKAEIVNRQRIPTGPICKTYKGLYVGLNEWDGSDFFIPDKSSFFIVTKKTATALKKDKTLNATLENLIDFEMPANAILNRD